MSNDPKSKQITDFISFYNIPSSVMNHPKHQEIKAAYSFYYAMHDSSDQAKLIARCKALMQDTLILAKQVSYFFF